MAKSKKKYDNAIAVNRRALRDYEIHTQFEVGMELRGWEVKSLRAGKARIDEGYVIVRGGEMYLIGCALQPLPTSDATAEDSQRTRRLLAKRREITEIERALERKGRTCVALGLHWKGPWAKVKVAIATGRKDHDKREHEAQKDWERNKARVLKGEMNS